MSHPRLRPFPAALAAAGGLLGAAGVGMSAAAAHRGGGDLAATGGLFCLLHAGAVIGIAALLQAMPGLSGIVGLAACLLVGGTILFSGDLGLAGLADWHPFRVAAPIGGGLLLGGWLALTLGVIVSAVRRR